MLLAGLLLLLPPLARAHEALSDQIAKLTIAIEAAPSSCSLLLSRAERLSRLSLFERALSDLSRVLVLCSGHPDALLSRGKIHFAVGQPALALEDLDKVVRILPSADAFAVRAEVLASMGERASAVRDFDEAIDRSSGTRFERPELYLSRGRLLESMGDLEAAAQGYEEGLLALSSVVLRLEGIRIRSQLGQHDKARALLSPLLGGSGVKVAWYLLSADLYEASGDVRLARRDRERALRETDRLLAKRESGQLRVSRARALLSLGDPSKAEQDAKRALALAPRDREALELLDQIRKRQDPNRRLTPPGDAPASPQEKQ